MKRPGARKEKEQEIELLSALRFISVAQKSDGKAPYQRHCVFRDDEVIAFDGILTAGHPVIETLAGCPETFKLIAALSQVRGQYSMVLLDTLQLSIRSDVFNALVPCIKAEMIDHVKPDGPNKYPMNNGFRTASDMAASYCTDSGDTIVSSAIVTQSWSLMGTNGSTAFIEAAMNTELPVGLVLPNAFVTAVNKIKLDIAGFSFSQGSFTIFFEGGAWLKTQVYQEAYPKLEKVMDMFNAAKPTTIPEGLWRAVDAVAPHSVTGRIWITNNYVCASSDNKVGAQHECDGLPFTCAFDVKFSKQMRAMMHSADFTTNDSAIIFRGDNVRGLLMKIQWNGER